MKKLLTLLFIAAALPARAVSIDTVVRTDHNTQTTNVYHDVKVSEYIADPPFEAANDYLCNKLKLKQSKRNKRGN